MSPAAYRRVRSETWRLTGRCVALMLLSAALGATANLLRPEATRLAWVGDWERHIETLAFRAGIPVTFLLGTRARVGDPNGVIFDARPDAEYAAGHLPGALSLPVGMAVERIGNYVDRVTPETPILVYCGGLDCDDALILAKKLREFGFSDVTLYPGGFDEWVQYGGAVAVGREDGT